MEQIRTRVGVLELLFLKDFLELESLDNQKEGLDP